MLSIIEFRSPQQCGPASWPISILTSAVPTISKSVSAPGQRSLSTIINISRGTSSRPPPRQSPCSLTTLLVSQSGQGSQHVNPVPLSFVNNKQASIGVQETFLSPIWQRRAARVSDELCAEEEQGQGQEGCRRGSCSSGQDRGTAASGRTVGVTEKSEQNDGKSTPAARSRPCWRPPTADMHAYRLYHVQPHLSQKFPILRDEDGQMLSLDQME